MRLNIASFTESSDVIANRGLRRLDELLIARITQKPTLVVIDDLSDVEDQHFDAVLNLLHNTLTASILFDVRFVLVAHIDAKHRIHEKISARFGNNFVYTDVELPQLPIKELKSSEDLPDSIIGLIQRHREFGPALNLKLIDWLVRSVQRDQVDVSAFRNDLDLLTWFWCSHVQNGQDFSVLGQALIKIAEELANRFTPDLPYYFDSSIENEALRALVRRDCLRVVNGRIVTTHRFVGDCARFYYLLGNRREIESEHLVAWLQNPFWVQPIRWFALQLALESSEGETWQEFLCEALEGDHLQLLDLLLDGAILSKQLDSTLRGCPDENLPFVIERLITRLLAIATEPYPFHVHADGSQSTSLRTRIAIQEQITGIPKADLWEPVWRWLLLQSSETVIGESCIVFRAAEAWLNWSAHAQSFSLRSEVANFTLDLAQTVLLPAPNPEHTWETRYRLCDFESNAFVCIVFSLRIITERSVWFLKALAGREIVSANRLEPRQEITGTTPIDDQLRMLRGNGVLQPGHPNGPVAEVNQQFRKFMLRRNGLYLNAVILTNPQLGVELFLALTIQPPHYLYEREQRNYDVLDEDQGTAGSDDIDVCTFKFLPLLSLLQIAEGVAISIVEILCKIVTRRNYQIDEHLEQQRSESEGNPEVEELLDSLKTDTHELTLLIGETRKQFQGGRKALYWHRNNLAPRILACLLMTLEGWLYSRPTRQELENSISLILERTSTVAMLGVLVSLAKCDQSLLSKSLLPLISSLQLLIWLESEQIDHGQNFGFDDTGAKRTLLQEDYQELLEFNRLSYRSDDLQAVILRLWIDGTIPSIEQSRILTNWDEHQLDLIPEISRNKALRIRSLFERSNWQEEKDSEGEQVFQFIGTNPRDPEEEVQSEAALWNLHHLKIAVTCRQILDGKREKTTELHSQLVNLLTSKEQINLFEKKLEPKVFTNVIWALIAIVLEPSNNILSEDLQNKLNHLVETFPILPISLNDFHRRQSYDLDARAFIAHVAPKLLRELQPDTSVRVRVSAFRCLIGVRDGDACAFMRSWIREYGLEYPLTQELIGVVPRIARLITLTYAFSEDLRIDEAWSTLEQNFVEESFHKISILEALGWTPGILIELNEQEPRSLQLGLDWSFLTAALTPIIGIESGDKAAKSLEITLLEEAFSALLYLRKTIYEDRSSSSDEDRYDFMERSIYLDEDQSHFLDMIVKSSLNKITIKIDVLIHTLKATKLVDCIILVHIVGTLTYCFIEQTYSGISGSVGNSFRNHVASAIGAYLFELSNQKKSDLQIIGDIEYIWEKLIDLLSLDAWQPLIDSLSEADPENLNIDQWLTHFFNHFQDELFPRWRIRRKLYGVGKLAICKKFRRVLFQKLTQHREFLPDHRNDESEALVQVLVELWDSDCTWIINKQSRCQDLRNLLGRLQEIDAVGARSLADQVASSLANLSN